MAEVGDVAATLIYILEIWLFNVVFASSSQKTWYVFPAF